MSFLESRQTPQNRQTNKKLVKILHTLLEMDDSIPFRKPVPHKALGLDDYKKIIKKPMDLNQVRRSNNQNKYKFLEEALDDIQLCWDNCMRYNHVESPVYQQAARLQIKFWNMVNQNFPQIYKDDEQKIRNKSKEQEQINSQPYFGNYQLPNKKKESQNILQSNQSNNLEKSSRNYEKIDNIYQESQQGQKMEEQENQSDHMNQSKQHNSLQQNSQNNMITLRQPIQINLNEKPTKQMITQLNRHLKQKSDDKGLLEQILQILITYEKEQMTKNGKGQINFNISNIHLTTYYRICKVARFQVSDMLEIIE